MDSNRHDEWKQICELVEAALELPPTERLAYLQTADANDEVRAEAQSLIAASETTGASNLDRGLEVVASALGELPIPSFWMGRRLGAYEVIGELGEGGMGLVLVGQRADGLYERKVAIKVIRSALAGEHFARRFRSETRILGKLQHPAITTLLDAGVTQEHLPFLVMEYVDGLPVDEHAKRAGLQIEALLSLVATLCDALAHAHAQGIVHQDVKPSNILVDAKGQLKLLDFGIARLVGATEDHGESTLTTFRAVTPAYASPEQFIGSEVDARSDVYSVGVVLYLLVTGELPFDLRGLNAVQIERILQTGDAVLPSRKAAARFTDLNAKVLDAVIGKAMHPDPRERYQTAEELKDELLLLLAHRQPRVSAARYLAGRWWRRQRYALQWTAMATVALLAGSLAFLHVEKGPKSLAETDNRRISIAVLPITPSSGQPWLASAVSEALGTELSGGGQIRVVPSADVAQAMHDLHVAPSQSLSTQARTRLGSLLGTQYVLEEKSDVGNGSSKLQLEGTLYRTNAGRPISTEHAEGDVGNLEGVTQELAVSIARVLPLVHTLSISPSLLPHSTEAIRTYTLGLIHLQALEPILARDQFEQAARIEPRSPLVHAALARTWNMLGYKRKATGEAETVMTLVGGLPLRTKLTLEAQADEIRRQWPAAITAYTKLRDFDPDEVEHVLGLARCQLAAGKGEGALTTLQQAEHLPALLGADPRIKLLASTVEEALSHHAAALHDAEEVLAAARERGATQLMAQAQSARAAALEELGKVDEGMRAAREAQQLFAQAGDIEGEAVSLIAAGNFLEDHARYEDARRSYLKARETFGRTGDEGRMGVAENDLGIIADDVGDPQEALQHYTDALKIFKRVDDRQRIPLELNNIGLIQNELSHPEAAKRSYAEALQLLKLLNDNRMVAQEYNNLGVIDLHQGKLDEAELEFKSAFKIYSESGRALGTIYATDGLAHVAWNRGLLDEAHAKYQTAIDAARKIPEMKQVALALRADAHVLHDRGDEQEARRELAESLALRQSQKEVLAAAQTMLSAITFDLDNGQNTTTDAQFQDLIKLFQSKNDGADAVDTELSWVVSLLQQRRRAEAAKHFLVANNLMRSLHDAELRDRLEIVKAKLAADREEVGKAKLLLSSCLKNAIKRHDLPAQMNIRLDLAQIKSATGPASESILGSFARDARSHGFRRVANQLDALRGRQIQPISVN